MVEVHQIQDIFYRLTAGNRSCCQTVDKLIIIKPHTVKYIANTAENIFSADRALIIS